MPIRVECPACKTALGAPDSPGSQRVRCPFCGNIFSVEPKPIAVPDLAPPRSMPRNEATQPFGDFEIVPTRRAVPPKPRTDDRRDARPPERREVEPARSKDRRDGPISRTRDRRDNGVPRDEPEVTVRKTSRLPVGLLVGLGVGVVGLFILVLGGGLLVWLMSSSKSSKPSAPTEVAQANEEPKPQPANADPAAPPPVPDRPQAVQDAPADDGKEEYVDLPERGEAIPGVAGLNPEPAEGGPPAQPPGGTVRVVLTNGQARHSPGRPGMFFHVNYRFEQGVPMGTMRYGWVIFTARGRAYIQRINPGTLAQQGSLDGQVAAVLRTEAPFRTFLIAEMAVPGRSGLQQVKISEELVIR